MAYILWVRVDWTTDLRIRSSLLNQWRTEPPIIKWMFIQTFVIQFGLHNIPFRINVKAQTRNTLELQCKRIIPLKHYFGAFRWIYWRQRNTLFSLSRVGDVCQISTQPYWVYSKWVWIEWEMYNISAFCAPKGMSWLCHFNVCRDILKVVVAHLCGFIKIDYRYYWFAWLPSSEYIWTWTTFKTKWQSHVVVVAPHDEPHT